MTRRLSGRAGTAGARRAGRVARTEHRAASLGAPLLLLFCACAGGAPPGDERLGVVRLVGELEGDGCAALGDGFTDRFERAVELSRTGARAWLTFEGQSLEGTLQGGTFQMAGEALRRFDGCLVASSEDDAGSDEDAAEEAPEERALRCGEVRVAEQLELQLFDATAWAALEGGCASYDPELTPPAALPPGATVAGACGTLESAVTVGAGCPACLARLASEPDAVACGVRHLLRVEGG